MSRVERAALFANAAAALWVGIVSEVLKRESRELRDLGPKLAKLRNLYARLVNRPDPLRSPK